MRSFFSSRTQNLHFWKDFFFTVADDDHIGSYYIFMKPFIRHIKDFFCSLIHKDAFNIESNLLNGIGNIWTFSIVFLMHFFIYKATARQFNYSVAYKQ